MFAYRNEFVVKSSRGYGAVIFRLHLKDTIKDYFSKLNSLSNIY